MIDSCSPSFLLRIVAHHILPHPPTIGAVAAIQDAAVLADLLYHLPPSPSSYDITRLFKEYRECRYPIAQQSYETSYQMSHLNEQVKKK